MFVISTHSMSLDPAGQTEINIQRQGILCLYVSVIFS